MVKILVDKPKRARLRILAHFVELLTVRVQTGGFLMP